MGDISIPMDWQPGDAVISINSTHDRLIGIVIEIIRYDAYGACAMVYWPSGLDFINIESLRPAFP